MESVTVYVLTSLFLDAEGAVKSKNIGVTFSLHQAELHRASGVEHEFDTLQIDTDWREHAATSELVTAMREFRDIVRVMQEEALR